MLGRFSQREAELQQHWRVENAERKAQLKECLRQCKEELIQGMALLLGFVNPDCQSSEVAYNCVPIAEYLIGIAKVFTERSCVNF